MGISVYPRTLNNQQHLKMFRFALASAFAAVALAENPAPAYKPAAYDETPKPYAFEYGVADDYSGAKFAQSETANGKQTSGSYSVNLPDGRVQTVTYTVDDYAGYVADVKYEALLNTQNTNLLTRPLQPTNQPHQPTNLLLPQSTMHKK